MKNRIDASVLVVWLNQAIVERKPSQVLKMYDENIHEHLLATDKRGNPVEPTPDWDASPLARDYFTSHISRRFVR